MTTMRIVGHRVEGARRRIPFQALFTEARAPQGSGPFVLLCFFGFQCLRSSCCRPSIALSQLAAGPGWTWHRCTDPACGSDNNHFGCAFAPPPEDSRVDGLAGCAGDSDPPCAAMSTGRAQAARGPSREGTTEMESAFFSSSRPGDGTGIRVRLRSGILGVRLSPGAPIICWVYCQSGGQPALDAGGCRFKSCHPDQHFCSANSVARVPPCQGLFTLISRPRNQGEQAPGSQGFDSPAERHPFFPR